MEDLSKKVVIVGDASCGKTSLAFSLIDYGEENIPELLHEDHIIDIKVKGSTTSISIHDTAGKKIEWQVIMY